MTRTAREIAEEAVKKAVFLSPGSATVDVAVIERALLDMEARTVERCAKVAELHSGMAECPRCNTALMTDWPAAKCAAKIRAIKKGEAK